METYLAYLSKVFTLLPNRSKDFLLSQIQNWIDVYTLDQLVPSVHTQEEYEKKIRDYDYYGWLAGLSNILGVGEAFLKRMKVFSLGYQLGPIGPHSNDVHPSYYKIELKEGRSGKFISTHFSLGSEKYLLPTSCYLYFKVLYKNFDKAVLLEKVEGWLKENLGRKVNKP